MLSSYLFSHFGQAFAEAVGRMLNNLTYRRNPGGPSREHVRKVLDSESVSLSDQELLKILLFRNYIRQEFIQIVESLLKHFGFRSAIFNALSE